MYVPPAIATPATLHLYTRFASSGKRLLPIVESVGMIRLSLLDTFRCASTWSRQASKQASRTDAKRGLIYAYGARP